MKDDEISRKAVLKLLSTMPPEEAMTKAMLIQSVKQMDSEPVTECNDLISRQAALKALKKNRFPGAHYIDTGVKIALREIKALPSAQPEIIRCRDCKLRDTEYCNMAHGFMGMKDDDYCSYAERREVSE